MAPFNNDFALIIVITNMSVDYEIDTKEFLLKICLIFILMIALFELKYEPISTNVVLVDRQRWHR